MRATFAYTSARILIFVVSLILLYLAGFRQLLLIGVALVVSGIVSFVLLSRQRDAMSAALAGRISSFRGRLDAGTRAEDDD
jgi:cell division protein FtsW (lipid II flippase)